MVFLFFFWVVSVTFQDLSYDMMSKKIQIFLNFFLLKKESSAKFTRVNLAAQTTHFVFVNYVFGQKIRSKKKSGGKGESEKIN